MALLPVLCLSTVFDDAGIRVPDARLSVFIAGTTTPAKTYSDAALSIRLPHPIPVLGNGLVPIVYVGPGSYRLRMQDASGAQLFQIEDVLIADLAGSGSGSGSSVDDKRLAQTGDIKDRYGVGSHPGWLPMDGRSLGSSASPAAYANDNAHDLFVYLWSQDANLAVSGGRGPNAESDWAAGKTIARPDARGRARVTLDDLGSGSAGRLSGGLFTFGNGATLGSYGGEAAHVQTINEIATHTPVVSATMDAQGQHNHGGTTDTFGGGQLPIPYTASALGYGTSSAPYPVTAVGQPGANSLGYSASGLAHAHNFTTNTVGPHAHNITVSVSSVGLSAAMNVLQPFLLVSSYIKL